MPCLLILLILLIVPIIDKPSWNFLLVRLFGLGGLIFYIPFVLYSDRFRCFDRVTVFLQLLFRIAEADKDLWWLMWENLCPGHVLILELITILRVVKIVLFLNALAGYHVQSDWGCSPHQIWHPTAYSRPHYATIWGYFSIYIQY